MSTHDFRDDDERDPTLNPIREPSPGADRDDEDDETVVIDPGGDEDDMP